MGLLRKLLFVIGLLLIVLPFLPFNIIPAGSLVGISSLDNTILSVVIGVLLLLLVFWSWKRERKRLFGGSFAGPRGPGDAQIMKKISDADLKRMQDVKRLRALQGA